MTLLWVLFSMVLNACALWNLGVFAWMRSVQKKIRREILQPYKDAQVAGDAFRCWQLIGQFSRAMRDCTSPNPFHWWRHWNDSYAPELLSKASVTKALEIAKRN